VPEIIDDFVAEAAALDELLRDLTPDQWLLPTPAAGWDVRDSITHLAMSNEIAVEAAVTGKSDVMERVLSTGSVEAYEVEHLARGRAATGADVLAWWRGSNVELAEALKSKDPTDRLPWGPSIMSLTSFVTARLMETWAHGQDVADALGVTPASTASSAERSRQTTADGEPSEARDCSSSQSGKTPIVRFRTPS